MQQFTTGFIDIHSHLLPVQDGPADMGQAIKALRIAQDNNITDMILTPHYYSGDTSYDQNQIVEVFQKLKKEIVNNELSIKVYLGNECIVDEKLIDDIKNGKAFSLNNTEYVLCEYPLYQVPCNFYSVIYQLMDIGYKPIIAHPERNAYIEKNYDNILELKENGCMIQLNAGSILGKYGQLSKNHAFLMLKDKTINFIASDAHSSKNRSPEVYLKTFKKIRKKVSSAYLLELFKKNHEIINGLF